MQKKCIIIGISGASGSGKSLLAKTIVNQLGSNQVVIISEDSYYKDHAGLSPEERRRINYDHPDAFDHALLCQHLLQLRNEQAIEIPIYNHALDAREIETRTVGPHTIIVLEGILLFVEKQLRDLMDIRIFMDTPLDICLIRRLKRDMIERGRTSDSVLTQYEQTVRPMYLQFVEPSKRYADVIVPRGGENKIAIDMITAKMRELLNNQIPQS
jgi:uridine kinase